MRKALSSFAFLTAALASQVVFGAVNVFDSIPAGPTYNLPSLGYQATSTTEFGPSIQLGGTARQLNTVTVGMSDWARESDYEPLGTSTGYNQQLTLNLYNAPSGTSPGSLFATKTITAFVPWRPENNLVNDPTNDTWLAPDGNTYSGIFFTVDFDFSSLNITLPDNLIVGLEFNTQSYGNNPVGAPGPYNSLNFALSGGTTVGSLPNPDSEFWNTSHAGFYTDGGAAGVGIFREDTGWTGYVPTLQISADLVPEPMSLVVWSLLGLATGTVVWRRNLAAAK